MMQMRRGVRIARLLARSERVSGGDVAFGVIVTCSVVMRRWGKGRLGLKRGICCCVQLRHWLSRF